MTSGDTAQLQQMWRSGVFEPSIHYIRFPLYKNLSPGASIIFNHPITALVGPNGTNKSSILRALQGCPESNNLGLYWFETAVDQIPSTDRHRFIYGRHSPTTGGTVEVIKTRILRPQRREKNGYVRRADPDYWEPSRPLLSPPDLMSRFPPEGIEIPPSDGSRTRWDPIEMKTLYLDFRSELSAFDATFNHGELANPSLSWPQALNARKYQIRLWAPRLNQALKKRRRSAVYYGLERIIAPARDLTEKELGAVSSILGKVYSSITVIRHRFFEKRDGWTAILRAQERNYSEAFAGSGEFAVVMLVTKIMAAEKHTLILMDEPEVSLHPAAQERLMSFLNSQSKEHKHQFVIATHSPEIVRELPPAAIKLLTIGGSGSIEIPSQDCPASAAFEAIGAKFVRPTVIVEDLLARVVVQHAIGQETWAGGIDVVSRPGGADRFWTYDIPIWTLENRKNVLLYFDGDQTSPIPPPDDEISDSALEDLWKVSFHGNSPHLAVNGGQSSFHENEKKVAQRQVLGWCRDNVAFLPFETPEAYVYPYALGDERSDGDIDGSDSHSLKGAWVDLAVHTLADPEAPTSNDILTLQKQAVARIPLDTTEMQTIRARVESFAKATPV